MPAGLQEGKNGERVTVLSNFRQYRLPMPVGLVRMDAHRHPFVPGLQEVRARGPEGRGGGVGGGADSRLQVAQGCGRTVRASLPSPHPRPILCPARLVRAQLLSPCMAGLRAQDARVRVRADV